ncbi:MAG: prepilin peptidase [bacterium]|nr:prepilin peptidase [bacterium]
MSIFFVVVGLALGSFANMWRFRYGPDSGKKIKETRSVCDYCGRRLFWWENVPIVSYLFLRGKSRCCGKQLPVDYVIVEGLGGLLGFLAYQVWLGRVGGGVDGLAVILLVMIVIMLAASLMIIAYDLAYLTIPIWPATAWFLLSLGWMFLTGEVGWQEGLLASGLASGFLLVLYMVTKGKGMGLGDAVLVLIFGWVLGVWGTAAAMWLAFVLGSVAGVGLVIAGRMNKGFKSIIALGPFLVTAFWISWAFQWWWILVQ